MFLVLFFPSNLFHYFLIILVNLEGVDLSHLVGATSLPSSVHIKGVQDLAMSTDPNAHSGTLR